MKLNKQQQLCDLHQLNVFNTILNQPLDDLDITDRKLEARRSALMYDFHVSLFRSSNLAQHVAKHVA